MARLEDIPEPTRSVVRDLACEAPDITPFVSGPPLAQRKIAIVSSAALIGRGDMPFPFGGSEFRAVPDGDILISHVSIGFDRSGFARDVNVVFPRDRLSELAAEGMIGGAADTHYTVMGSTDPATMAGTADGITAALRAEGCTGVLLLPV